MKDKREILQALLDGKTLINTEGDEINDDNFDTTFFDFPKYWSIKKRKVKMRLDEVIPHRRLRRDALIVDSIWNQIKDQYVEIDE